MHTPNTYETSITETFDTVHIMQVSYYYVFCLFYISLLLYMYSDFRSSVVSISHTAHWVLQLGTPHTICYNHNFTENKDLQLK